MQDSSSAPPQPESLLELSVRYDILEEYGESLAEQLEHFIQHLELDQTEVERVEPQTLVLVVELDFMRLLQKNISLAHAVVRCLSGCCESCDLIVLSSSPGTEIPSSSPRCPGYAAQGPFQVIPSPSSLLGQKGWTDVALVLVFDDLAEEWRSEASWDIPSSCLSCRRTQTLSNCTFG